MTGGEIRKNGLALLGLTLVGCQEAQRPSLEYVAGEEIGQWIETLSSDEFEGRGPSSPGEEKTINYLRDQFRAIGLKPGNGDDYFQEVPLVELTVDNEPRLRIGGGDTTRTLVFGDEAVLWTKRVVEQSQLWRSDLVFVGYGIVAPEYNWNDYDSVNVRNKTVVILVNDPGFATQDASVFNGNTMTYYGRWTYKFEEAARQGARGVLIVHETAPAGYGWGTVASSWTGPQFDLVRENDNMSRAGVEGWITAGVATELFRMSRQNFDRLKTAAAQPGFRAVELDLSATVTLRNNVRRSTSNNVLGVLPGTDRADEYVIYMAHWDHFGRDPNLEGDQIYNGGFDNATGVAGLLALAKEYASRPERPSRSILFMAVTAEEQGLLGSAYYASNPVYPRTKTVAAINLDGMNVDGPMRDITVVGYGNSELDDYITSAAESVGRVVRSDPEPEKGFYYRSDHFSFAKEGVPALYTDAGIDHVEHGEQWTLEQRKFYTTNNYHKPSDEYDPTWDLTGMLDDLHLLFEVGHQLANSGDFPNWREGTEFKAKRDADMAEASREQTGTPIGRR